MWKLLVELRRPMTELNQELQEYRASKAQSLRLQTGTNGRPVMKLVGSDAPRQTADILQFPGPKK